MSTSPSTQTRPDADVPLLHRQAHEPSGRRLGPASGHTASQVARAERTFELLTEAAGSPPAERQHLLDEVVTMNMSVATAIAARYRTRGIASEDLQQVAYLALVKAAHGYDPTVGHDFLSYAVPTIRGEIKRHFRDLGWMVRPPRRIQELQARITTADAELSQSLGRSPRPSEIARHLDEGLEDVNEALATVGCFLPSSLDRPAGESGTMTISDLLGSEDPGQGAVEARTMLAPVVRQLCERDRRILLLRFFRGLTQQEIAEDIGVTQMQVSRLLTRIMGDLRRGLEDSQPDAPLPG
ncbi:MAG TPA: sigma-70 family RNA polymerase sigma factor [Nocardioidaceae bacterium]|nr:sigma-70 family RNA polymerase sigma factor [Nocardioidaceae bacterium]